MKIPTSLAVVPIGLVVLIIAGIGYHQYRQTFDPPPVMVVALNGYRMESLPNTSPSTVSPMIQMSLVTWDGKIYRGIDSGNVEWRTASVV